MSGGTTIKELVAELGLEVDEAAFEKGEAILHGLHKGLLAVGAAAVGAAAFGLVALTKATAEAGDHARKLAQSTGINSIELQKLGYAAELADVSTEELAVGLRHLAKTGIKDVQGEVLRLAERFRRMPDDGAKVALAMEKFGRAGARLIPLLNGGREELSALMAEAEEFGVVIGEEDQKAAEEFNDQIKRLSKAFEGLRNRIGLALIRPLTSLVVWFRKLLHDVQTGATWVHKLAVAMKGLAVVLGSVLLAALIANAAAVWATVTGYVAMGAAAVLAGLKAAAAWLAAVAPVALLAVLIAAVVLAAEDFYTFLQGGDSLIGTLGPKWAKFLDDFAKPRAADPWWLAALRTGLRLAGNLEEKLDRIFRNMRIGYELFKYIMDSQTVGGSLLKAVSIATSVAPAFSGGAVSPQAAAAVSSAGKPPVMLQPNVSVSVVATPGMNEADLASKTSEAINEALWTQIRAAAAGRGQ